MNIKAHIKLHVGADGPVSFDSIAHYVRTQGGPIADWDVAQGLNDLIMRGEIRLYDDGKSFVEAC